MQISTSFLPEQREIAWERSRVAKSQNTVNSSHCRTNRSFIAPHVYNFYTIRQHVTHSAGREQTNNNDHKTCIRSICELVADQGQAWESLLLLCNEAN